MRTFHLFIRIYYVLGFINTSLVCFNSSDIKVGSSKAFITFNWKRGCTVKSFTIKSFTIKMWNIQSILFCEDIVITLLFWVEKLNIYVIFTRHLVDLLSMPLPKYKVCKVYGLFKIFFKFLFKFLNCSLIIIAAEYNITFIIK